MLLHAWYKGSMVVIVAAVAAVLWVNTLSEPFDGDALEFGITATSAIHIDDNWCVASYYFPHEPLRRDFLLGSRALTSMTSEKLSWQLSAFFEWWSHVSFTIHGHHWTEETIFIPGLQRFGAPKQEKFALDHHALLALMDEVSALETGFHNGTVTAVATHSTLKEKWSRLSTLMLEHLAEEEESCRQIVAAGITPDNMSTIVKQILDETPASHLLIELAHFSFWHRRWTVLPDGTRHSSYEQLLGEIPLPVRVLTALFYAPRFADQLRLLQSIELGVPFAYDAGAFGGWRGAELLVVAAMVAVVSSIVLGVGSTVLACVVGDGNKDVRRPKKQ
eukprot:c6302_g1_i1.p1 GENE.c6302_g1_i1~~c6302_g1_i1.p1  ORF type:complete len:333 (-),score=51.76 c6302_g1_i1:15-1013(-)